MADRQPDMQSVFIILHKVKALGTLERHAHHLNYLGGPKSPPHIFQRESDKITVGHHKRASTREKRGDDTHRRVCPSNNSYRKTEKTINYFFIFPTVFPGHKICQLRNNNHRLRSGAARGECDNTLERTLHFRGEKAWSKCVQLVICLHLRLVCMRRQIQEYLLVLRKQLKGLVRK